MVQASQARAKKKYGAARVINNLKMLDKYLRVISGIFCLNEM